MALSESRFRQILREEARRALREQETPDVLQKLDAAHPAIMRRTIISIADQIEGKAKLWPKIPVNSLKDNMRVRDFLGQGGNFTVMKSFAEQELGSLPDGIPLGQWLNGISNNAADAISKAALSAASNDPVAVAASVRQAATVA